MEVLSHLPACEARLSCWGFLGELPGRLESLSLNLELFERMVQSFHTSQELPTLLGIVLAFGNYMNGGRNEKRLGQADGFHIEALGRPGGLDVVNDPQGRNIRQLIFKTYFSHYPDRAARLLQELAPLFALVQRRLSKSDGSPVLRKDVRVQIEELDRQASLLKAEFSKKRHELQQARALIDDPLDSFVKEVPYAFELESRRIDELVEKSDTVKRRFKELLVLFRAETYRGDPQMVNGTLKDGNPKEEMTSNVWCLIWDDFFVNKALIVSQNEKLQKDVFEPRFCKDAPLTVEGLEMLWQLRAAAPVQTSRRRSAP